MYGPVGLAVQYLETAVAEPYGARIVASLTGSVRRVRVDHPHGGDFDREVPHEDDAAPGDPRWRYIPSAS